jgi:hypothetical protein
MPAQQDANIATSGAAAAPGGAIPCVGGHLHGLHRGAAQGRGQIRYPHSGRPLLQVRTFFIELGHPYTASSVARAFFDGIVRRHGFPASVVGDRGLVFASNVWRDLFKMAGVTLCMSTAFKSSTPKPTATRRWLTRLLPCTFVVLHAIGRVHGWTGCHGRSIAILPHSTPPFARRPSRGCMAGRRRPGCPTRRAQHARRRLILSCTHVTTF